MLKCFVGAVAAFAVVGSGVALAPELIASIGLAAPYAALKSDRLDRGAGNPSCRTCLNGGASGEPHKVVVVPANPSLILVGRPAHDLKPPRSIQDLSRCASLPPSCSPL